MNKLNLSREEKSLRKFLKESLETSISNKERVLELLDGKKGDEIDNQFISEMDYRIDWFNKQLKSFNY